MLALSTSHFSTEDQTKQNTFPGEVLRAGIAPARQQDLVAVEALEVRGRLPPELRRVRVPGATDLGGKRPGARVRAGRKMMGATVPFTTKMPAIGVYTA